MQEKGNATFTQNVHTNAYNSFIPKSPKPETTQMAINRRHPYNGILFSKKEELLIHATKWMHLKRITLSERSQTHTKKKKNPKYYMIPCMWNSRKGKTVVTGSRSVVDRGQRCRERLTIQQHGGALGVTEMSYILIVRVGTYSYLFAKLIKLCSKNSYTLLCVNCSSLKRIKNTFYNFWGTVQ